MSTINQNLLAETFSCMKVLDLSQTSLTKDQSTALLSSLAQSRELADLRLTDNDLSHVELPVLSSLVARVESLDLVNTNLQPSQIIELVTRGKY